MKLTLSEIKKYNPCNMGKNDDRDSGWNCLIDHLGHDWPMDKPIKLTTILDSNGLYDCLWSLRCLGDAGKMIAVKFALACAQRVAHIFNDKYPNDDRVNNALNAVQDWINNPTEENKQICYAAYAADAAASAAAGCGMAAATAADAADAYAAANTANTASADKAREESLARSAEIVRQRISWSIVEEAIAKFSQQGANDVE